MKSQAIRISIAMAVLIGLSSGEAYQCQKHGCWQELYKNRCMEVTFDFPRDATVRMSKCPANQICNYRPNSNIQWPTFP